MDFVIDLKHRLQAEEYIYKSAEMWQTIYHAL